MKQQLVDRIELSSYNNLRFYLANKNEDYEKCFNIFV